MCLDPFPLGRCISLARLIFQVVVGQSRFATRIGTDEPAVIAPHRSRDNLFGQIVAALLAEKRLPRKNRLLVEYRHRAALLANSPLERRGLAFPTPRIADPASSAASHVYSPLFSSGKAESFEALASLNLSRRDSKLPRASRS